MRRILVLDASVVLKWLLANRPEEQDSSKALLLLSAFRENQVELRQPAHWLAEVTAVLTRLSPDTAADDIADLCAMSVPVVDDPRIYLTASTLARTLQQHVFDTLYHAVALNLGNAVLITADERYYRRAGPDPTVASLASLSASDMAEITGAT